MTADQEYNAKEAEDLGGEEGSDFVSPIGLAIRGRMTAQASMRHQIAKHCAANS